MNEPTLLYALFQGDHSSTEDAVLVGVFVLKAKAEKFRDTELSDPHTDMKREANWRKQNNLSYEEVPDLYWDIRPVALDPRAENEIVV